MKLNEPMTQEFIEKVQPQEVGKIYACPKERDLYLRVYPSGKKTLWFIREIRLNNNRWSFRRKLGSSPDFSLTEARKMLSALRQEARKKYALWEQRQKRQQQKRQEQKQQEQKQQEQQLEQELQKLWEQKERQRKEQINLLMPNKIPNYSTTENTTTKIPNNVSTEITKLKRIASALSGLFPRKKRVS